MTVSANTTPATCIDHATNLKSFVGARLGLFIHFGLYSILGRGEWVINREQLSLDEYRKLADQFDPTEFDADALVGLAAEAGCRYVCFTTMHHEGFALYDSDVVEFNSVKTCGRDFAAEIVAACRKHGLRVHLYHTLNQWMHHPEGVAALESKADYERFITFVFDRLRELATKYSPVECIWYDGWWPFDANGWRAEEMNRMLREIQPHILLNERNCGNADFATPEQHLATPYPWRPWEACITHNGSWGYHRGDNRFKPLWHVIDMITQAATGGGNVLLNVGPDGKGRIPDESTTMLRELGQWMRTHGEAIYDSEPFIFANHQADDLRGDWATHGRYTVRGNTLYYHLFAWPGQSVAIGGVKVGQAQRARLLGSDTPLQTTQNNGRLEITGLPDAPPHSVGGVVAIEFDQPPTLYLCGGMRTPNVDHPRYDPCEPDLPPV